MEYLGSARYDEDLAVYCRAAKLGPQQHDFPVRNLARTARVFPAPLITAELVYVNADPKTMKAAPLPDDVRARVRAYERTPPVEN